MTVQLDERASRYIADVLWVQRDIWKLPPDYPRYEPGYCETFSDRVHERKWTPAQRQELLGRLHAFGKVMQGPFHLGDGLVVGGFWNKRDSTRGSLGKVLKPDLSGARVLEIGSMSGYDAFFVNMRKPAHILSIEPSGYIYQAQFLNEIYGTEIEFQQTTWQDLDHALDESFDVVLNCGCLYHEYDFISMIKRTVELLKLKGEMILATAIIKDKAHAGFIKYMPDSYAGDMSYWFAIGEKALVDLFASFGCSVELVLEPGLCGDSGNGRTVEGHEAQKYNYYRIIRQEKKARHLRTFVKY
jgi:2-polyprenyl-3-methyl-5-hydroxy-6-metoxy-1,4-benzoquinol methylase